MRTKQMGIKFSLPFVPQPYNPIPACLTKASKKPVEKAGESVGLQ